MRKTVCLLITMATLTLAGCNNSGAPAADMQQQQQTAVASKVTGTVALREGVVQPSAQAKLVISLVDVSAQNGAALTSKTIESASQFPQSFELDFNAADINPSDLYVVKADLNDGDRHYAMVMQAPVLTKGARNDVAIQLMAEQTAAEKERAALTALQRQIGGMKITSDSKLQDKLSRAWQVFRASGEVKLIRVQADYDGKAFTTTDYAYRDGKPWAVEQQKKAAQSAKPESTCWASWDGNGKLVLKQVQANGQITDTLSAEEGERLKKEAVEILHLVTAGKGK